MSEYEMKKSLRRTSGASKVYVQIPGEDQAEIVVPEKPKQQFKGQKESIFDQKKWSAKERIKLLVFLSYYRRLSDWQSERKSVPLYKQMSNFMKKTRTPEQCKNIHSLLKRKYHSMESILQYLQDLLECEELYGKLLTKYLKEVQIFEKENKLSQNPNDFINLEPLAPRLKGSLVKEEQQLFAEFQQEPEEEDESEIVLHPCWLKPEEKMKEFQKRAESITEDCQFFFKQWLKCVKVLEYRVNVLGE